MSKTILEQTDTEKFLRMFYPKALSIAKPYLKEEELFLQQLLLQQKEIDKYNFIAVGAGPLFHLALANKFCNRYIAVDPEIHSFLTINFSKIYSDKIDIVPKRLENLLPSDVPNGRKIYMLLFNVISYINNPLKTIQRLINAGDIIFISGWSKSILARAIMEKYFKYVNYDSLPNLDKLYKWDEINILKLTKIKKHELKYGKYSNSLVLFC